MSAGLYTGLSNSELYDLSEPLEVVCCSVELLSTISSMQHAKSSSGVGGRFSFIIWSLIESFWTSVFSSGLPLFINSSIVDNLWFDGKGVLNRPIYYCCSDYFFTGASRGAPKKSDHSYKLVSWTKLQSSQTAMPWFLLLSEITDLHCWHFWTDAVECLP